MSVVKTVGRGVAWNTAATVFGKVLIFANVFIILNYFSVYEYGFSELIMSIISMGAVVLLPGLTTTILADLSVERGRGNLERMNAIFHQFFFLSMLLGFLTWIAFFFVAGPIAHLAGNTYAGGFLKIASFLFLIAPLRTMSNVLASVSLRFFDQSFYGVFEEVAKLALILLFVVNLSMGVHGLIYAIVISQLLIVLAYVPRTYTAYKVFSHARAADRLHFWNLLRNHRKWSIGASYVGTFAQNLRIWIIKLMLGTEAVGLFAFAYGMYSHIVSLMPLSTVLTPIIPRYIDARDQLARIMRASIKIQFVIATLFLAGAWLTSYAFVHILFPKYVAAILILYILLITVLSNSVVSIFTPVFAAFKEQQSLLLSNVFKSALTVLILPPAIFLFGTVGPAIEIVLTSFFNGIERYIRVKRVIPEFTFKWRQVLHPDAYEKEAMATLQKAFLARLPRWFNS